VRREIGTRGRALIRVLCVLAAVAALSAPAAFATAVKPLTVKYEPKLAAVQPGTINGFNQRCPAKAPYGIGEIFGNAATSSYGQVALANSGPLRHGWTEGVADLASGPERFFAGAVCSSRKFDSGASGITLQPGQSAGYTELCPRRNQRPLSGFSFAANGSPADVIVTESAPVGHGWVTTLTNQTGQPQKYEIGVVCAPSTQRVVYLSTGVETIGAHQDNGSEGRCPRRAPHPVAGLFSPAGSTPAGAIAMTEFLVRNPTSPLSSTSIVNLTGQTQHVIVGSVCLG
jgi:hypothetical protein